MLISNHHFFSSGERRNNDKCPVCKTLLGAAYTKTERVYDCDECDLVWVFHPHEDKPTSFKRKHITAVIRPINPSWEDVEQRMEGDQPPEDYHTRGWMG
jgi:hypothetical protein